MDLKKEWADKLALVGPDEVRDSFLYAGDKITAAYYEIPGFMSAVFGGYYWYERDFLVISATQLNPEYTTPNPFRRANRLNQMDPDDLEYIKSTLGWRFDVSKPKEVFLFLPNLIQELTPSSRRLIITTLMLFPQKTDYLLPPTKTWDAVAAEKFFKL